MSGDIAIDPFKKKTDTACKFCSLRDFCGFDKKIKGYDYRLIGEESGEDSDDADEE